MYRQIYKYEVTMRILYKDGKQELKTTLQQAYSVGDAVQQASYSAVDDTVERISVDNVAPPADDIRKQESELMRAVVGAVEKIMKDVRKFSGNLPEFSTAARTEDKFHTDAVATTGSKATVAKKI